MNVGDTVMLRGPKNGVRRSHIGIILADNTVMRRPRSLNGMFMLVLWMVNPTDKPFTAHHYPEQLVVCHMVSPDAWEVTL